MTAAYEAMFRQALRIRLAEEKIAEIYPSDKIQSPVHLSIGQEPHTAALMASLAPGDQLYTTYRSHAAYLAKGGDMRLMFAELYGKASGISKGKAGSMHLCSPEHGLMGCSAIVAATISHAIGAGYAFQLLGRKDIVVSLTGDGSTEEGVFHECLNFAALRKLPVLFVIENNGLAIHAHLAARQAFSLEKLAAAYGIPYFLSPDGLDMPAVAAQTARIAAAVRGGAGPAVYEIRACRYMQHVGVAQDFDKGYRDKAEFEAWRARDPLVTQKALIEKFRPELDREIAAAVDFAEKAPFPSCEEVLKDVF